MTHLPLNKSPFFIGYIDPSAGHVFTSLGPLLSGLIGIILGTGLAFLKKIKNTLFGWIKQALKLFPRPKSKK